MKDTTKKKPSIDEAQKILLTSIETALNIWDSKIARIIKE